MNGNTRSPWLTGFGAMEVEAGRRREVLAADARRFEGDRSGEAGGVRLSLGRVATMFRTRTTGGSGRASTSMSTRGCATES